MNDDENRYRELDSRPPEPENRPARGPSPGGLTWPIRRFFWFVEKRFLWPVQDSFKRIARTFRYQSPMAYIGATMLLTLTAAAIGAAVYFHNETKDGQTTVAAAVPAESETLIAATPTPPAPQPSVPAGQAKDDDSLKGVVPDFNGSAKNKSGSKKKQSLPATVVRPSDIPDSPPLRVAQNFAETFVDYEIGKKSAAKDFGRTATTKLSRELQRYPPRLPSGGKIPKAKVLNVVKGRKYGERMDVSVSLMRSGATSELRLALKQEKKKWLVSEVRG
jgi:hypothetical protein